MPETITALKKENQALKVQDESLTAEFKRLEDMIQRQNELHKRSEDDKCE